MKMNRSKISENFLPSPLRLEGYGISSFRFSTDEEYNLQNELDYNKIKLVVDREYKTNIDDQTLHFVRMKISVTPKRKKYFPYYIHIDIGGVFKIQQTDIYPEEKIKSIVYINGASILYGIAREYIFMSTCHSMCGPFMLPSISFIPKQVLEESQSKN